MTVTAHDTDVEVPLNVHELANTVALAHTTDPAVAVRYAVAVQEASTTTRPFVALRKAALTHLPGAAQAVTADLLDALGGRHPA